MKYFAYGNNLSPGVLKTICAGCTTLGPARLDDHRLAFTRRSATWEGGAADIVEAPGLCVWGVLFEIDEGDFEAIDRKEGCDYAYTRCSVQVRLPDDGDFGAIAYTVMVKEPEEIPPKREYLQSIIEGARAYNLNRNYIDFLESITSEDQDAFRKGFLVRPTVARVEAIGMPLVRVSRTLSSRFRRKRLCVVSYRQKAGLAMVVHGDDLPGDVCELDQSMRHALSAKGRVPFGVFVQLFPTAKRAHGSRFLAPRTLVLPMHRPSILDSEKQVCVLHAKNINLLGLSEGAYVTVRASVRERKKGHSIRTLSRRVYSGSAKALHRLGAEDEEYPDPWKFYMDLDGRLALGLSRDDDAVPVLIAANLPRLWLGRILYYATTLMIGLLAVYPLLQTVCTELQVAPLYAVVATILLAAAITVVVSLVDMRSRIQY